MEVDTNSSSAVCSEIDNIIRSLVANLNVSFKSQQRDESEPSDSEKTGIALESFHKNKTTFLLRFGRYLNARQLEYFEQFTEEVAEPADYKDIKLVLIDLRKSCVENKKNVLIKNRRYEALQKMIREDAYFSEIEMMKRNPLLYEQLVGQFLTEQEKRERDKHEMNDNITLVKILMEGIDRNDAELSRQLQQQNEDCQMEESDSSDEERPVEQISVSVKSARPSTSRWGEFEEQSMKTTKSKKCAPMLTAPERLLLKEEFFTTMYESFVDGKDKDFDYNSVDTNTSYDCINEMTHDAEDKYFDSEEPDDGIIMESKMSDETSEEDELDMYMRALNQHPAVCELAKRINQL